MASVCSSVTLLDQDHIGWKSSEPKGHPPTPRGTLGNLGETRGGVGKVASRGHLCDSSAFLFLAEAEDCFRRTSIQSRRSSGMDLL